MDELQHEFAAGIAGTATRDIEAALDRALKRAETHAAKMALVKLREKALGTIERIMQGRERRLPAAVLDEVLSGIHGILHPAPKMALAKRASGEAERKPEGEELVAALIAVAKEFREMADRGRKAMRKLGAEARFDEWEKSFYGRLAEALRRQDLQTAQIIVTDAFRALNALLDEARVDQAIGEPGGKALIPGYHAFR